MRWQIGIRKCRIILRSSFGREIDFLLPHVVLKPLNAKIKDQLPSVLQVQHRVLLLRRKILVMRN